PVVLLSFGVETLRVCHRQHDPAAEVLHAPTALDRRRRDRPHRASCFVGGGTVVRRPGRLRPIWEEPELWLLRLDRDRRWRRRAALVLLSPANVLALHGRHAHAVPLSLAPERRRRRGRPRAREAAPHRGGA